VRAIEKVLIGAQVRNGPTDSRAVPGLKVNLGVERFQRSVRYYRKQRLPRWLGLKILLLRDENRTAILVMNKSISLV